MVDLRLTMSSIERELEAHGLDFSIADEDNDDVVEVILSDQLVPVIVAH